MKTFVENDAQVPSPLAPSNHPLPLTGDGSQWTMPPSVGTLAFVFRWDVDNGNYCQPCSKNRNLTLRASSQECLPCVSGDDQRNKVGSTHVPLNQARMCLVRSTLTSAASDRPLGGVLEIALPCPISVLAAQLIIRTEKAKIVGESCET